MTTDLWGIDNGGQLHVHLHQGQARAWNSEKRFVTVAAGTQGGKTSFGPLWLYREIQRCGPGDYIVAAPTFPLLSLKLLPEFKRFFEEKGRFGKYVGSPVRVFTFSKEGAKRIFGPDADTDTPTQIFFGHAQDPDSLESATAKAAWLDEAGQKKFKRGSWEAILRRLAIHEGRVLTTSTPYSAFGWFKTELHDKAKAGDLDYDWIRFESVMNPRFSVREFERARASLPKWKFDLFYRAILTRPAGMIYDCWNDGMIVPAFTLPAEWPRYMGLDFGGVNTAAVFLAENPMTKELYLYREYHEGGRTAKQHVTALLKEELGIPSAYGGAKSEGQWRGEFAAAGLPVSEPPVSDVEVGIDRAYAMINSDRLRVFDTCDGFLTEVEQYSRELDDNDEPTEKIEDKNRFHILDAFRYVASQLEHLELPLGDYDFGDYGKDSTFKNRV